MVANCLLLNDLVPIYLSVVVVSNSIPVNKANGPWLYQLSRADSSRATMVLVVHLPINLRNVIQ